MQLQNKKTRNVPRAFERVIEAAHVAAQLVFAPFALGTGQISVSRKARTALLWRKLWTDFGPERVFNLEPRISSRYQCEDLQPPK